MVMIIMIDKVDVALTMITMMTMIAMTVMTMMTTSMESGWRKENGFGGGGVFFLYRIPTLEMMP